MLKETFRKQKKLLSGVTLVETLLYIALTSLLMLALTSLFGTINRTQVRAEVIETVNQQGAEILRYITEEIRTSTSVSSPTPTNSSTNVVVVSSDTAKGNVTFSLSGGKFYVTESAGSNTPIQISNNLVIVSNVQFINASQTTTNGNVKIQFTLSYVNPNNQSQFNYSQIFYGTASTRY